jgi:hypothetical protein
MTTQQSTNIRPVGYRAPLAMADATVKLGDGEGYEEAMFRYLDNPSSFTNISLAGRYDNPTVLIELAPLETIRTWLDLCTGRFAKAMAYGLVEAAASSYDNKDWNRLAEAVVSWGATLQIEADRPVARRLRRQLQASQHDNPG